MRKKQKTGKFSIFGTIQRAKFLMFVILFSFSCGTNDPIIEDNTKPGRRDYEWTVDTLSAPNIFYRRMWASSQDDIWLVSASSWDKSIAHYNGMGWNYFGVSGMLPYTLYGFSESKLIIASENAHIWHFDGFEWSKIVQLITNNRSDIAFEHIWGESSSSYFVTGGYPDKDGIINISVVAQYLRNNWVIHDTKNIYGTVSKLFINTADGKIYLNAVGGRNFTDSTKIYEFLPDGKSIPLYSDLWTKGKQADISLVNGQVFFVMGNRIATRENNTFKTVLNVDNPNFYQRLWGRSSKDLFLLMTDGLVHYNGSNLEYLFYFNFPDKKPWIQIFGAAIFEEEVFFLVSEANPSLNLIYKGKLR